jgi:two-component system cell cycle response regulator
MNNYQANGSFEDILIVDDSQENLRVLSSMLAEGGYKVRKVINGTLALKVVQMAPPALILLDIVMPELNGYEVCSLLKANYQTSEIPVIFISALQDISDKVKAFELGGVDYITKPFQAAEILARVKNQLTIRNLHLQLQQQTQSLQQQNALLQQEIRERQRAEAETTLLLKTVQAISSTDDFDSALEVTLRQVCLTIGWDFAEAWIPNSDCTVLQCSQGWYATQASLEKFRYKSEQLVFIINVGLTHRIWMSKQPEWIEDISLKQQEVFLRCKLAQEVGLTTALSVPIVLHEQMIAILVFFNKKRLQPEERLIKLINGVATQLASLIQRKKAEAALKVANHELQCLATLDSLTGIANRRKFDEYLSKQWELLAQQQLPLSLVICDIDFFKNYNDTYSHLAGDFCLQQVAQAIANTLNHPTHLLARYGGEEFVVLLPNTNADGALCIAEKVRFEVQRLEIEHAKSCVSQYITLSTGVASFVPQKEFSPLALIAVADRALYEAKQQGRNRSVVKNFESLSSQLLLNRLCEERDTIQLVSQLFKFE